MDTNKASDSQFRHAFMNDALGTDDAVALSEKLKGNEVSPGMLARASIVRAQAVNPSICAINYLTQENRIPS